MYSEITKAVFDKVVTLDIKTNKVEYLEHASKAYYFVDGVQFLEIDNYLTCTTQYYVRDINA